MSKEPTDVREGAGDGVDVTPIAWERLVATIRKSLQGNVQEGVELAEDGTLLAQFQKDRTDAIDAMFERDNCNKLHTTSRFFADLDNNVRHIITTSETKGYERGQQDAAEVEELIKNEIAKQYTLAGYELGKQERDAELREKVLQLIAVAANSDQRIGLKAVRLLLTPETTSPNDK